MWQCYSKVSRVKGQTWWHPVFLQAIERVVEFCSFDEGADELVVLVNNLGTASQLEMGMITGVSPTWRWFTQTELMPFVIQEGALCMWGFWDGPCKRPHLDEHLNTASNSMQLHCTWAECKRRNCRGSIHVSIRRTKSKLVSTVQLEDDYHHLLTGAAMRFLTQQRSFSILRCYSGTYMTSLDMHGFSITLMRVSEGIENLLDSPCQVCLSLWNLLRNIQPLRSES